MKHYPSIFPPVGAMQSAYLFVKYDGSNVRFEFSHKQGWYKFGTRNFLLDQETMFGPVVDLFKAKYADDLEKVFKTSKHFRGVKRVIVFAEWFGAKSFAGQHEEDDPKELVLFDVNPISKGFMGPRQFLDEFGHLRVAELVYQGDVDQAMIDNIVSDKLVFPSGYGIKTAFPEGVICKGGERHKLWMSKIKHKSYIAELRRRYPLEWEKMV